LSSLAFVSLASDSKKIRPNPTVLQPAANRQERSYPSRLNQSTRQVLAIMVIRASVALEDLTGTCPVECCAAKGDLEELGRRWGCPFYLHILKPLPDHDAEGSCFAEAAQDRQLMVWTLLLLGFAGTSRRGKQLMMQQYKKCITLYHR
jgi:hypothetical protein